MYTVAIETEGKLVNGRNKPTWKQAESYALALHNQVSTGHLGGAAVVILDDKAVEVKRFGAGRKRNSTEQLSWAEVELSRVLDAITPQKAVEIIRKLAKGGNNG